MNNTAENDFFRFHKVKWLHLTGLMDTYQISRGFNIIKIVKID